MTTTLSELGLSAGGSLVVKKRDVNQLSSLSGKAGIFLLLNHYPFLVYTTQVNSAFCAYWLASSEVISQVLFTSDPPKKNKMAFVVIF